MPEDDVRPSAAGAAGEDGPQSRAGLGDPAGEDGGSGARPGAMPGHGPGGEASSVESSPESSAESSRESSGAVSGRAQARRRRVEGGRHHRHVVRVTPEEEARLLALALRYRVSVPKLLVDAALAGGVENARENESVRHALIAELFGLHRLLASVANNVNQMTRALHSTGELPPQTADVLAAVRRTAERIDSAVDGLTP